jgi:hypothetical protein
MPCKIVHSADGNMTMIMCSRKQPKKCYFCGNFAHILCDYPIGYKRTCDKWMCGECKTTIGHDIDVCPEHNNAEDIEKTLKGR